MSETPPKDGAEQVVDNPDGEPEKSVAEDQEKKALSGRVKDVEVAVPIVYGTIAFWLGRKATESQSHKWSVYVRGAANEDLGAIVKHVVFQLHPSFNNPIRVIDTPPFELSECGWGEFEIAISLYFHSDASDTKLDLFHHLKLYPTEQSGPQSTKKPVVVESYDEIVFPDPSPRFLARLHNHPALVVSRLPSSFHLPPAPTQEFNDRRGNTKDHPLGHWFTNFSENDELLKLVAARHQVKDHILKLKRQMNIVDGSSGTADPASAL